MGMHMSPALCLLHAAEFSRIACSTGTLQGVFDVSGSSCFCDFLLMDCMLLQGIEEDGIRLAQVLTKKESIAKMKSAMPADVAKALARVSGGLYVVAAVNKSARGAMLASWVAQASFEPLGLTVAVAKDRAIESLMQVSVESCTVLLMLILLMLTAASPQSQ